CPRASAAVAAASTRNSRRNSTGLQGSDPLLKCCHDSQVVIFGAKSQDKALELLHRKKRERDALRPALVAPVGRKSEDLQVFSVNPPKLRDAQRGVDRLLRYRAACDVDLDGQVGRWVDRRLERTVHFVHRLPILDVIRLVGFQSLFLALVPQRRLSARRQSDSQFQREK